MHSAWIQNADGWVRQKFEEPVRLEGDQLQPAADADRTARIDDTSLRPTFYPRRDADGRLACLLLTTPDVTVNGEPLPTGIRELRDRDAIGRPGSWLVYYSSERLAVVAPYDGTEATYCSRCRLEIRPGDPAVRCPGCDAYHCEQPDGRKCWSYQTRCSLCDQSTDLEHPQLRWSPEML